MQISAMVEAKRKGEPVDLMITVRPRGLSER